MRAGRIFELDTVRALAVLLVLAFHLDISYFGFLGVDMFFVLSGFLMTKIMLEERDRIGRFLVLDFLKRRFWRIAPPLIVTCCASLIFALLLFSPSHLIDFSNQLISTLLIHSNLQFFNQAGYFEPANEFRPLLHTWSLSVEEQFYLLFALLLAVSRFIRFETLVYGVAVLSLGVWIALAVQIFSGQSVGPSDLGVSQIWPPAERSVSAMFYLAQFRAVQFLFGILTALALKNGKLGQLMLQAPVWQVVVPLISALIILLMGAPRFSSYASVPVAFATILLMLPNPMIRRIGQWEITQFIAKTSYQVYLVHWPLIVFWKYATFQPLGIVSGFVLAGLSILLGWGLWRLTAPLTLGNKKSSSTLSKASFLQRVRFLPWVAVMALCGVSAGAIKTHEGFEWRVPEKWRMATPNELRAMESAYCGDTFKTADGQREYGSSIKDPIVTCEANRMQSGDIPVNAKRIYLFGDSHARHLVAGFATAFPNNPIEVMYFTSCHAQSGIGRYVYDHRGNKALADACVARNQAAMDLFKNEPPSVIVIHQYAGYPSEGSPDFFNAAALQIETLKSYGHKVVWISPVIRPNKLLAECVSVPVTFPTFLLGIRCAGDPETARQVLTFTHELKLHFPDEIIDVSGFFCASRWQAKQRTSGCKTIDSNGKPLFRDKHHLTVQGSIELVNYILSHSDLEAFVN